MSCVQNRSSPVGVPGVPVTANPYNGLVAHGPGPAKNLWCIIGAGLYTRPNYIQKDLPATLHCDGWKLRLQPFAFGCEFCRKM